VSLRELPAMVRDGTVVLSAQRLARKSGEEILTFLSTVRGIGHWTAEMFLLFQLRRLDVWPAGDFGIRRGYGLAWEVPTPTARELGRRVIRIVPAARWRPGIAGGPLSSAERQARAR
jgi:DNA-3-methyladenine glycosylase II